jgi:hypothetical protein
MDFTEENEGNEDRKFGRFLGGKSWGVGPEKNSNEPDKL